MVCLQPIDQNQRPPSAGHQPGEGSVWLVKLICTILAAALSGASCIYFGSNAAFSDEHDSDVDSRLQSPTEIRAAVAQGQLLPLPRILALARAHVSGDTIKIELESKHGRLE